VAFVGPLTSFIIGVVSYGLARALGMQTPFGAAAWYLGWANIVLAVFNLVPAYPLDGGKVLHSLIWRATGDRRQATRIAAGIGQTIALTMVGFGIFLAFAGNFASGIWLAVIGWFLNQAGRAEAFQTELAQSLRGHPVRDIATVPPPALKQDDTARTATDMLLRSGQRAAPVVSNGHLVGIVTLTDLARAHATSSEEPLSALMTPASKIVSVAPATDSLDALSQLAQTGFHQLPVIDESGTIIGFITRDGVLRRLTYASGHGQARG